MDNGTPAASGPPGGRSRVMDCWAWTELAARRVTQIAHSILLIKFTNIDKEGYPGIKKKAGKVNR